MPRSDYLKITMPLADFLRDPRARQRIADMTGFSEEARMYLGMRGIEHFGHLILHRPQELSAASPAVMHSIQSVVGGHQFKLGVMIDPNQFSVEQLAQMLARATRMPVAETKATPHRYFRHEGHIRSSAGRPASPYYGRPKPEGWNR